MQSDEPKHTEQTEPPFQKYSLDPDTLLRKRLRIIDGENGVTETLSEEAHVEKNGSSILVVTEHMQTAADGRELPVEDFMGKSWTGERIPVGCGGMCCNPYDLHEEDRMVYKGVDGTETDNLNFLCKDCNKLYERKLEFLGLFPPFLHPLIFFFWEPEIL
jgi:hypothetical protein